MLCLLLAGSCASLLLIPFIIFLYAIGIVVVVVYWIAWVPVLFAGQYPERLFDFMVYALRLQLRLSAYAFGLTDRYPKFFSCWARVALVVARDNRAIGPRLPGFILFFLFHGGI